MGLFDKWKAKEQKTETSVKQNPHGVLYIAEIPYETGELHFRYSRKMSEDGTKWIREGYFASYYQNGNISSEGIYEDGFEEGDWKDYHENGVLAAEGRYLKGKEIGKWRFYNDKGELEEEENYG